MTPTRVEKIARLDAEFSLVIAYFIGSLKVITVDKIKRCTDFIFDFRLAYLIYVASQEFIYSCRNVWWFITFSKASVFFAQMREFCIVQFGELFRAMSNEWPFYHLDFILNQLRSSTEWIYRSSKSRKWIKHVPSQKLTKINYA